MKSPNCFYLDDEVIIKPYGWLGVITGFPRASCISVRAEVDRTIRNFAFSDIRRP